MMQVPLYNIRDDFQEGAHNYCIQSHYTHLLYLRPQPQFFLSFPLKSSNQMNLGYSLKNQVLNRLNQNKCIKVSILTI